VKVLGRVCLSLVTPALVRRGLEHGQEQSPRLGAGRVGAPHAMVLRERDLPTASFLHRCGWEPSLPRLPGDHQRGGPSGPPGLARHVPASSAGSHWLRLKRVALVDREEV